MSSESIEALILEEESRRQPKNWFEKMEGYLQWKAVGPEVHAPYRAPLSDRVLVDLAYRPHMLLRLFDLRCMCDGYEVLHVRNLNSPIFVTDHPCISTLSKFEMTEYLERGGVMEIVKREVEKKRIEILDELARRDLEVENEGTVIKKKSTVKKAPPPKPPTTGQFRIIRR